MNVLVMDDAASQTLSPPQIALKTQQELMETNVCLENQSQD